MSASRCGMSSFGDMDSRSHAYSRKDKSLGLLCVNFLKHYTQEQVDCISLDEAASRLGVERRRIYDIVNVLESVGVLVRKAKNSYTWKGYEGIPQALENLREAGLKGEVLRSWRHLPEGSDAKQSNVLGCVASDDEEENSSNENCCPSELGCPRDQCGSNKCNPESVLTDAVKRTSDKSKQDCRREKSLGLLTQKFVQLFLVTEAEIVSLEEAARLLIGECKEPSKLKTKVRRLYDIANILSSLNLIEKTHSTENRKPAFRWLGVKGEINPCVLDKATKKRKFGTEISLNSVESSPRPKRGRACGKCSSTEGGTLKDIKARGEPVYSPVPLYPSDASLSTIPVPKQGPKVSTGLTLGTSRGSWREWTTIDSQGRQGDAGARSRDRDCPSTFTFGPFCPFRLQQQCLASISLQHSDHSDTAIDSKISSQESEGTSPFKHSYLNEGIDDMFMHYLNAWKAWYMQIAASATATAVSPGQDVPQPCDSASDVPQSHSLSFTAV